MSTQTAYAIISTGGKQHRVKLGQRYKIEKVEGEPGESVELSNVILTGDGDKIQIGTPFIKNSKVTAKILSQGRGEKITIIKMRRRKGYRRKQGHRQSFTEIEITGIK